MLEMDPVSLNACPELILEYLAWGTISFKKLAHFTAKFKGKKKNLMNTEKHVNIEEMLRNSKKIFYSCFYHQPHNVVP